MVIIIGCAGSEDGARGGGRSPVFDRRLALVLDGGENDGGFQDQHALGGQVGCNRFWIDIRCEPETGENLDI